MVYYVSGIGKVLPKKPNKTEHIKRKEGNDRILEESSQI